MGLFTLLFALGATISETIQESIENHRAAEEQRRYEDIDWYNIESVTSYGTRTAFRVEEEEEYDPTYTIALSEMNGAPCYGTRTVQHLVEDGENYCFKIRYKNGTEIYREFHEDSPLTERLLEYCNDNTDYFSCEDDVYISDNCGTDRNKQALRSAKSYLNCGGHSYLGLIHQLQEYEKFTPEQAKYAVDNCGADWNEQALMGAKSYLDCDGFSYSRLIHQLQEHGKFTPEQAKYGVENSGADWNAQAVKSAKSYLECFDYSRQRLIEQLINQEKFTDEQAEYAANAVGYTSYSSEIKPEQPKERFVVIDLETTGLNYNFNHPPADEIISVAIIDQDENVLLDTYCDTVNIKSWDEAERIHGISPEDVKGYPTFVEILPKVVEILRSYDYVIAYNIKFEKLFIQNYAYHYARDYLFEYGKVNWGDDPMEMFMNYINSNRFQKLETAARHFGYTYNAHNALEDTKAALYVYNALRNK